MTDPAETLAELRRMWAINGDGWLEWINSQMPEGIYVESVDDYLIKYGTVRGHDLVAVFRVVVEYPDEKIGASLFALQDDGTFDYYSSTQYAAGLSRYGLPTSKIVHHIRLVAMAALAHRRYVLKNDGEYRWYRTPRYPR